MKSLFGMFLVLLIVLLVVASGGLIWYLSTTAEFSRNDRPAPAEVR